jgi:hypothetical protein
MFAKLICACIDFFTRKENLTMFLKNKIVPVALGAALLGGSVGALVMRQSNSTEVASAHSTKTAPAATTQNLVPANGVESQSLTASNSDNQAFRDGFTEGVRAAREEGLAAPSETASANTTTNDRVVYQPVSQRRSTRARRSSGQRQVYYDYNRPQKRSFWQKHRDKLTVGIGAGGGALIGGLAGGKKGALIGALAGGGGAALYTYKLRNRNRRY